MVQLQELTINKDNIFEIVNKLLEPSNVAVMEFMQRHVETLSLNLNRSLIECTIKNNIDAVEILLNLGADISTRDGMDEDYTPLHWAVYEDEDEMVKFLLDHGADIEEITNDAGVTALHLAAHKGFKLPMKILLENGANVNSKDKCGKTPLHEAASMGNKAEAQLLIEYGADVKAINGDQTAADYARSNGYYSVARWLMEMQTGVIQGENSDTSDETEKKSKITQFLKRLLKPDDKIQVLEFLQNNIHYFGKNINTSLAEAAINGNVILTEILLDHGADIATIDDGRGNVYAPLHWAVYNCNIEVVEYLLDRGAAIEQKTSDIEETALHIAASIDRMEILKILLDRGANVNAKDNSNKTPLHKAATNGKRLEAALLIKYGADIKAISNDKTPAEYAKMNDHDVVAKWLNWKMEMMQNKVEDTTDEISTKHKIKTFLKELIEPPNQNFICFLQSHITEICEDINKALKYLIRFNKVSKTDVLIAIGADISIRMGDYTLLHWTAQYGNIELVKLLLDHGANIEEQTLEEFATPLHIASSQGEFKVLKLLLDRGANVNARMINNRTPLHEASESDVADLLIMYGADIEAESQDGTPLHIAASEGKTDVLKVIIQRGANLHARNNMNRTPLHEAAGSGHQSEAALLVRFGANVEAKSDVGTPADYAGSNGYVN